MNTYTQKLCTCLAVAALWVCMAPYSFAASATVQLELQPFCEEGAECSGFEVENPQMLRTPELQKGDALSLQLVAKNPDAQEISRIRSWLTYDPYLLKGEGIRGLGPLSIATPGEAEFSHELGYAKIEFSTEGTGPTDEEIVVAKVEFTVIDTIPSGTVIGFYDVQATGHTDVVLEELGEEVSVLQTTPAVLRIVFGQEVVEEVVDAGHGAAEEVPNVEDDIVQASLFGPEDTVEASLSSNTVTNPVHSASVEQPAEVAVAPPIAPPAPPVAAQQNPLAAQAPPPAPEAIASSFSLLQVQNVSISTEGPDLYIAWDPLRTNNLKGYNVYYGTRSQRYIQRKTVGPQATSIAIENVPEGTVYYVAIRAFSVRNEESSYSNEVSITVGNPATSSSPFIQRTPTPAFVPNGPVQPADTHHGHIDAIPHNIEKVHGETGLPSVLLLFGLICGCVGTLCAVRRQKAITIVR